MVKLDSDKVMFEIYREAGYDRRYRVVYFTELSERNRDLEIGRAMNGEHLLDGFLAAPPLSEANAAIRALLGPPNADAAPSSEQPGALPSLDGLSVGDGFGSGMSRRDPGSGPMTRRSPGPWARATR